MENIHYGRKRSGIKKELQKKIGGWIESIDDLHVRKLAKENTIVCGGAIASMLLGDSVNDYDVYFRNQETTLAIAEYYVNKFNKSERNDVISHVECTVRQNSKGIVENRVMVITPSQGVNITNNYDEDTDFSVSDTGEHYRPLFLSENAISLSNKIQLVIRFYGNPDVIFDNYDFVHAMNYYDYYNRELVLKPEALESILSRSLVYKGSLFPIASIFRMKKFLSRGWRISAGQQLKIMFQISDLDMHNINVLREQLIGVDIFYMHSLLSAIENANPELIDTQYISEIIDNIFAE